MESPSAFRGSPRQSMFSGADRERRREGSVFRGLPEILAIERFPHSFGFVCKYIECAALGKQEQNFRRTLGRSVCLSNEFSIFSFLQLTG